MVALVRRMVLERVYVALMRQIILGDIVVVEIVGASALMDKKA